MSLIQLANAASRYLRSGKLQGVMSLIQLANAASRYLRSGKLQEVRCISAWLHRIISSHILINV